MSRPCRVQQLVEGKPTTPPAYRVGQIVFAGERRTECEVLVCRRGTCTNSDPLNDSPDRFLYEGPHYVRDEYGVYTVKVRDMRGTVQFWHENDLEAR